MAILKAANGLPLTHDSCSALADGVIPDNALSPAQAREIDLPGWAISAEAEKLETKDWLDRACYRAAANQVRAIQVLHDHDAAHSGYRSREDDRSHPL